MDDALLKRIMKYAGKKVGQLSNPCLTVRECIKIADHIAELDARIKSLEERMKTPEADSDAKIKITRYDSLNVATNFNAMVPNEQ